MLIIKPQSTVVNKMSVNLKLLSFCGIDNALFLITIYNEVKLMLKSRIRNKEKLIGMYVQLADISIARIAGLAGYDFVWVDTEHSYMSYETLLAHIIAIKATGTAVIVRAPQNDLTATKKIIEMGVDGIIFPMIKSRKDSDAVISDTLYPPYGTRGFGPMNAIDYGFKNATEYLENTCDNLCRFIQIEHKGAVEDIDAIMQNPHIDGYIFGPNDLAGSYGFTGKPFCDEMSHIIRSTIKKLHANGKYAAIASGGFSDDVIKHWSSFDPDMLSAGADFDFIRDGAVKNRINLENLYKK